MAEHETINIGGDLHGGAWKVAYADFVTAMMAFFLLLWLLNVTTDEQLNAISNYFDPTHPKVSQDHSGAGGVLGGLSMTPQGSMATDVQDVRPPKPEKAQTATQTFQEDAGKGEDGEEAKDPSEEAIAKAIEKAKEELRQAEEEKFKSAEEKIKQAIQEDPELQEMSKNLLVDVTPEGLRIQIVDQEGKPMFASGSAQMFNKTRNLMTKVAGIIQDMPNEISIRGHTDSVPYGPGADYTNWELSTDRAHSTRRTLLEAGLPKERLNNVVGKADTEHLIPEDPTNASNRRISIILLKEELTNPDFEKKAEDAAVDAAMDEEEAEGADTPPPPGAPQQVPVGTFRKTPGAVEFP